MFVKCSVMIFATRRFAEFVEHVGVEQPEQRQNGNRDEVASKLWIASGVRPYNRTIVAYCFGTGLQQGAGYKGALHWAAADFFAGLEKRSLCPSVVEHLRQGEMEIKESGLWEFREMRLSSRGAATRVGHFFDGPPHLPVG